MNIYDFYVKDINGNDVSLSKYRNKVILIVNTATRCGFTKQYKDLENIYEIYNSRGFEILDFPCNQFLNQAPESDEKIDSFCKMRYNTSFDRFKKIDVKGKNIEPLYLYLINNSNYLFNKNIKWNFTKFLIDRNGNVVRRFSIFSSAKSITKYIDKII
ncbi:glutathione peroxidase [Brachyspira hampsonii]|uniref:glutathione peroxidase n=1 Tax=Brachyspira hampsonii TaxID=1287055 RepID=UPI000D34642A|nr:glutathione peroxidase [Brachyspira hampsonii]PTY41082.1 glutathione peroxidase [Brachyspira hampsonii bv. II]